MNRFSLAALLVLIAGILVGSAIYWTAPEAEPTAYIIIGDTAHPYDPTASRAYVSQLERFGGKAAVLFDDFNRWFTGLWVGKALGLTIACISAGAALLLYWIGKARR